MRNKVYIALLAVVLLPGCVWRGYFDEEMHKNHYFVRILDQLRQEEARLRAENVGLRDQYDLKFRANHEKDALLDEKNRILRQHDERLARLDELYREYRQRQPERAPAGERGLPDELRGIEGLEVEATTDGYKLTMQGEVFFMKGEHTLTAAGKASLLKMVPALRKSSVKIRIEGHTDGDPVKKRIQRYPHGNMQLAGERALEVLAFLRNNGVAENKMYFVGYGPYRPKVPETGEANKKINRRCEIFLSAPQNQVP